MLLSRRDDERGKKKDMKASFRDLQESRNICSTHGALKCLIILVVICCTILMYGSSALASTAYNVDEAIKWLYAQVGKSIDMDGVPYDQPYQCVDLIKAYYQYLGMSPVTGNGEDYAWCALPIGWIRVQGGTPQRGDILVYSESASNEWGHVGIFESTRSTFHQNVDGAYVFKVTYCNYNGFTNPYWGYIRPDFVTSTRTRWRLSTGTTTRKRRRPPRGRARRRWPVRA